MHMEYHLQSIVLCLIICGYGGRVSKRGLSFGESTHKGEWRERKKHSRSHHCANEEPGTQGYSSFSALAIVGESEQDVIF